MEGNKILFLSLVLIMILTLTACEEKQSVVNGIFSKELKTKDLSISDFEWETKASKCNGYDCYTFSLTNNSSYDLIGVEFTYKVKDDVDENQLVVYEDFMKEHDHYIKENDSPKDVILKNSKNISVLKGETMTDLRFTVGFKTWYWYDYPTKEQFELMEPAELQIGVIGEDNKLYVAYYDFVEEKWLLDEETKYVDTWSKSDISKIIEKPLEKHHIVIYDEEEHFKVYSYGITIDGYKNYIDKMKKLGFVDDDYTTIYYNATNSEGYVLELWYYEDEEMLSISIEKN